MASEINIDTIRITPEFLSLIAQIDEFKGPGARSGRSRPSVLPPYGAWRRSKASAHPQESKAAAFRIGRWNGMSLIVDVDNPNTLPDAADLYFMEPAGFEIYRHLLWGTEPMRRRSKLLAEIASDLYLCPEQFDEFEEQCRIVELEADDIAREIGWSVQGGESIRQYIRNFYEALAFARKHGSEVIRIW